MHEVLVNCLVKLAQEKSVVRWTDKNKNVIINSWILCVQIYFELASVSKNREF